MTITINWNTFVINIPKTDTLLIQSVPTEIRELNLNTFRLALKDIEDSEEGMVFPITHNHNTEVSLGGLTYARVIEILAPYTVTFEDGQYAVNLVGANSNVGDKTNVNQVSVRSNNAAGLISTPLIEYASYNNVITIDAVNGTDSSVFPYGTTQSPCKTLINAGQIAVARGFKSLFIIGDLTIIGVPPGVLSDFTFLGQGQHSTTITVVGVQFLDCTFQNCTLQGTFAAGSDILAEKCHLATISNCTVSAYDCSLTGTISLVAGDDCNFFNCIDGIAGSGSPVVAANACVALGFWAYTGGLKLTNLVTVGTNVSVNFNSGRLIVDGTDTQGSIIVRGIGSMVGTTGGTTVNSIGLLDNESIPAAVWDSVVEGGYSAEQLLRLQAAALAGKLSGAAGTTVTIRDISDTKDRIVATVDADGNRSAVSIDAS